mmetsp:Transcript_17757/g.33700  ORF Transcript_17757/g.33700 Transcript_17757/m.33700 type:complete len:164 (+) Transcript_17757:158-649(+)|eukprot:scaffold3576_cov170-Amphora_coffeaeformis.AAC.14
MGPHLVEDSDNTPWQETNESSPPVKNVLISSSAEFRAVSPLLPPFYSREEDIATETGNENGSNGEDAVANVVMLDDQQIFLLFVKISSLYVCRTKDAQLKRTFKATISKCTAENRRGNPDYTPLQKTVEERLRKVLGETHWNNATYILRAYCRKNRISMNSFL